MALECAPGNRNSGHFHRVSGGWRDPIMERVSGQRIAQPSNLWTRRGAKPQKFPLSEMLWCGLGGIAWGKPHPQKHGWSFRTRFHSRVRYLCIYRLGCAALCWISTGRVHLQKGPASPKPPSRSFLNFIFSTPHTALYCKVLFSATTDLISSTQHTIFHNAPQGR